MTANNRLARMVPQERIMPADDETNFVKQHEEAEMLTGQLSLC